MKHPILLSALIGILGLMPSASFATLSTPAPTAPVGVTNEAELMISIDKAGVAPADIQIAVNDLNHVDSSMSTCFVQSAVKQYIDYVALGATSAPYYGVAIVTLTWTCDQPAHDYLDAIEASPKYTLYSNPPIGPAPAISGSN